MHERLAGMQTLLGPGQFPAQVSGVVQAGDKSPVNGRGVNLRRSGSLNYCIQQTVIEIMLQG